MLVPGPYTYLYGMEEDQPAQLLPALRGHKPAQGCRVRPPHIGRATAGCSQADRVSSKYQSSDHTSTLHTKESWSPFSNKANAQKANEEKNQLLDNVMKLDSLVSKALFISVHPLLTMCLLSFYMTVRKSKEKKKNQRKQTTLQMRCWILLLREQRYPSAKLQWQTNTASALISSYNTTSCCTQTAVIIYPSLPQFRLMQVRSIASLFTD